MKTAAEIRGRMGVLMQESKGLIEKYPDFVFPDDAHERMTQIDAELGDLKGQLVKAAASKDMVERLSKYNEYMDAPASNAPTFPDGGVMRATLHASSVSSVVIRRQNVRRA
jgi:hypothetical protein